MKKVDFPDNSLFVCTGSKCTKHNDLRKELKSKLKHLPIEVFKMECTGRCKHGPIMSLQPANIWYYEADEYAIKHIIEKTEA